MGFEKETGKLLQWFADNARILPWREHPAPYYIWISEIMLQQTRVEAVKAYFERFIREIPDIQALADVSDGKLLKLWEGLGYYNRAKNLKKAARQIVEQYQGELPESYEALLTLPGIGTYTAGAIASQAFQIPVPAVDGNVLRVYMRYTGRKDDIAKETVKKQVAAEIAGWMPEDFPGNYNQALMELGAMVCIPNGNPHCEVCPISRECFTEKNGCFEELPVKTKAQKRRIEKKTILVIEHNGKYLLWKREEAGLLAGMWEFPWIADYLTVSEITEYLEKNGIEVDEIRILGENKHIFSHIEWHMIGYSIHTEKKVDLVPGFTEYVWSSKRQLEKKYAIPVAYHAYLKDLISSKL